MGLLAGIVKLIVRRKGKRVHGQLNCSVCPALHFC
jgi:hypothetical protein